MFHPSTSAHLTEPASAGCGNSSDRRAYPRIPSVKLPITRVRIPNRPAVALVDLSSGGALLNLPFQLPPESRFALQLETLGDPLTVPFQLIRCYVSNLHGGVTYHAGGAFDSLLDLRALAQRSSTVVSRLIDTLERMRRGVRKSASRPRSDAAFDEVLGAAICWLRRDESLDLVALKVKAHLTQTYPSLMIVPCLLPPRDEFNSVACFGLTLRSKHALSAHDRRLLKANAQLISMLEHTRRQMSDEEDTAPAPMADESQSPMLIRTAAEWLMAQSQSRPVKVSIAATRRVGSPVSGRSGQHGKALRETRRDAHNVAVRSVFSAGIMQPAPA